MGLIDRLVHAWNAFTANEKKDTYVSPPDFGYFGSYSSSRPDRSKFSVGNERSIVNAVYNRIAIDVSNFIFKHVQLDEKGRYKETIDSSLNQCLSVEANKDQGPKLFIRDIVQSMLDEGVVAVFPVETKTHLDEAGSISTEIISMRTAKIVGWYPDYVRLDAYDDRDGQHKQILMKKKDVAIIENPFYSVMNERNSTLQRLIHKLNILDAIDTQSGSGKMDLIIQLPYVLKSQTRQKQAAERAKEIENQLSGSKYGIAYTDGTEKIIQLNRPVENNMLTQVQYLTSMFYGQLSMDQTVMNGTANETTMTNYRNSTLIPIGDAIIEEFRRKFLSKNARSRGQSVMYFDPNPLKNTTTSNMAEIADKFTRNAILSSNEIRQFMGMTPVNDPRADELSNKNMPPEEGDDPISTENNDEEDTELDFKSIKLSDLDNHE